MTGGTERNPAPKHHSAELAAATSTEYSVKPFNITALPVFIGLSKLNGWFGTKEVAKAIVETTGRLEPILVELAYK